MKLWKTTPKASWRTTLWALVTQEFQHEFGYLTNPKMYFTRREARENRLPYEKVMKISAEFKEAA